MSQLPLTFNEEWLPSLFLSVVAAIKNPARAVIDWWPTFKIQRLREAS
jgi:hypothetical protein